MKVVTRIHLQFTLFKRDGDDVATEFPVIGQKVKMMTGNFDASGCIRKTKPNDRSACAFDAPLSLVGNNFAQRFVWLGLTLDTAKHKIGEDTIDSYGNDRRIIGGKSIKRVVECIEIEWPVGRQRCRGSKRNDDSKGSHHGRCECMDGSVSMGRPRATINNDEFAVERLHGSDSERAKSKDFGECGVAVVATGHERLERSGLDDSVFLGRIVVETGAGERPNMERPDEPVVDDVAGHGREGRSGLSDRFTEY